MGGLQSFRNLGMAATLAAIALYALASSPTPDSVGPIELMIMVLLLVGCLCGAAMGLKLAQFWRGLWAMMLAYGLCVPTVIGAVSAAPAGDMARDIVAYSALALPLCLTPVFNERGRIFLYACVAAGVAMAARYIASPEIIWHSFATDIGDTSFLYLANSPLVMLAALWLMLSGFFTQQRLWLAVPMVIISLVPFIAMLAMSQRATIAILVLAWGMGVIVCAVRNPIRAAIVLAIGATALILGWDIATAAAQSLLNKTIMLGSNARVQEWAAVLDALSQGPITTIFGTGWGASLPSPAVGDVWVRFVHGFMLASLWKMGFFGLALTLCAFAAFIISTAKNRQFLVWVCFATAAIAPFFLYGSYKSLCFGLILTGIALSPHWTSHTRNDNQ